MSLNGKLPVSHIRKIVAVFFFAAVVAVSVYSVGDGNQAFPDWRSIALVCPLGLLGSIAGGHHLSVHIVIAGLFAVLAVAITGKAFCSWACPVKPLDTFLKGKQRRKADALESAQAVDAARTEASTKDEQNGRGMRYAVLVGSLLSALLFGFPVFCLVCPIGLLFATALSLYWFIGHNLFTWGILIFPCIVILELTLLKKWCSHFCPLGALLSLLSRFNKTFVPKSDASRCLRKQGKDCYACVASCPERIDPSEDRGLVPKHECTRCYECANTCPAKAINFKLKKK